MSSNGPNSPAGPSPRHDEGGRSPGLRPLGLALLLASYVPVHRLLSMEEAGPAGEQTRSAADAAWASGVAGTGIVLGLALVLALVLPEGLLRPRLAAAGRRLTEIPTTRFSFGVGMLALLLSSLIAWGIHGRLPTSVDEMSQLLHARALVGGGLTLSLPAPFASWLVLNGTVTESGWASLYPPLHTAWLAVWMRIGLTWLAGPVATAAAAGLTAWSTDALLEDRATARAAGLLLAFSPFFLLVGGTHLSHPTAAALVAGTLVCAVLTIRGRWSWSLATGAAAGAAVCARPWTGMVVCAVLVMSAWLPQVRSRGAGWFARRAGGVIAGGMPFAALLLTWNSTLFGHPLRLGYTAAFGPAHALGLHRDPWGNRYGIVEAIGYTGADVVQLGAHLLQTPFPAVALVGVALLLGLGSRASDDSSIPTMGGVGTFLAWGLAGLAANSVYWHHGFHMGPRMLYETSPAWVVLWVAAAVFLTRAEGPLAGRARVMAMWVAVLGLAGAAALTPSTLRAYRIDPSTKLAVSLPANGGPDPSLVFAHGSWASRVATRLEALGMRRDSIETALRQNDLCSVDLAARARGAGVGAPVPLDLEPRPGTPEGLQFRSLSPGNTVRVDPNLVWDEGCMREARADRFGSVELEPLAWQTSPARGAILVVRDQGPALNAAVMEAFPDHRPWMWIADDRGDGPALLPYQEGAELLWGGAAGVTGVEGGG